MPNQTDRLNTALAGRYRIERHLGEGGMASVYLCEDLKHERKVALKLLKPELAAVLGAERFVQEIKTTAALQHPHILPLFDSGTADGFLFYVMPWIQGETLREKLNRETQLGVDEAVRIAREVADALDYAHRHGVIHRDIKPENILLHDGRPMVADFGIALAVSAAAGGRMTETGLSLGTPHYMSPEQATAEKEITARSDIYSIGSVLYEMLTGNPPHTGASAQQIIMKIITEPAAPVTQLRKSVPPNVAAAVAKSLEKLPADRFESAKAFAEALGNPAYTHATIAGMAPASGVRADSVSKRAFGAVALVAVVALAAALWGWRVALREPARTAVRFTVDLPADIKPVAALYSNSIAISPDGRDVVFAGMRNASSTPLFFRRSIDDPTPHEILGTEGGYAPFFSPDGKSLGFFVASGQLRKVQLAGGVSIPVAEIQGPRGATWTRGNLIIIGAINSPLLSVPASGGTARPIGTLKMTIGSSSMRNPVALDDGETVLFTIYSGALASSRIGVLSLSKGTQRVVDLPGGVAPLGVLDGQLIYGAANGALMVVPFDVRTARITGNPASVVEEVGINASVVMKVAVSASGSLAMMPGGETSQLVLSDLQGSERVLVPDARVFSQPRFSPDGKRVAVGVASRNATDIWIYDLATGTPGKLTSDGDTQRPEWTPDGRRVLYQKAKLPTAGLQWQPSDFSGAAQLLQQNPTANVNAGVISPDGHYLLYRLNGGGATEDLHFRRLDGDTTSQPLAATKFLEYAPRVSPDGHWVAYASDPSGELEVYVQAFPALGARFPVSSGGGQTPMWSPDGKHIFFVANGRLHDATVSTARSFSVLSTKPLFDGNYDFTSSIFTNYDVAPDGKHLLLVKPTAARSPIVFVHDWKYELRGRMRSR
jgi:serine/threonine-protein kinase